MEGSHLYCGIPFEDEMSSLGPENWCLLQNVIGYEQKEQQSLSFVPFIFLVMTERLSKVFKKQEGRKVKLD